MSTLGGAVKNELSETMSTLGGGVKNDMSGTKSSAGCMKNEMASTSVASKCSPTLCYTSPICVLFFVITVIVSLMVWLFQ